MTDVSNSSVKAAIEAHRASLIGLVQKQCDELMAKFQPAPAGGVFYQKPSLTDGHDPRNKNGLNLTPRGVEILYRVFDDGGGYNRAAKMLNITQAAAKNRKVQWVRAGGLCREKAALDIDTAL
jgi:hypothetical protein